MHVKERRECTFQVLCLEMGTEPVWHLRETSEGRTTGVMLWLASAADSLAKR